MFSAGLGVERELEREGSGYRESEGSTLSNWGTVTRSTGSANFRDWIFGLEDAGELDSGESRRGNALAAEECLRCRGVCEGWESCPF